MAASVTPLWSSHTPVCCNRGFFPALAAQASASLQAPSSGSVQVLGYRYGDGVLAVPWVTLLVATTFSPCPLAQEWKHRILRSPHAMGQVGTGADAPFSLAVACEADPARPAVRRTKSRAVLCILS